MPNDRDQPPHGTPAGDGGTEPRGPYHGQVDEASGGADSSPLETVDSGSQAREAQDPARSGQGPDPQLPQPPSPR